MPAKEELIQEEKIRDKFDELDKSDPIPIDHEVPWWKGYEPIYKEDK